MSDEPKRTPAQHALRVAALRAGVEKIIHSIQEVFPGAKPVFEDDGSVSLTLPPNFKGDSIDQATKRVQPSYLNDKTGLRRVVFDGSRLVGVFTPKPSVGRPAPEDETSVFPNKALTGISLSAIEDATHIFLHQALTRLGLRIIKSTNTPPNLGKCANHLLAHELVYDDRSPLKPSAIALPANVQKFMERAEAYINSVQDMPRMPKHAAEFGSVRAALALAKMSGYGVKVPTPKGEPSYYFSVGDEVIKDKGDYTFKGKVVSVFVKASGQVRYCVENAEGVVHIFNANQLRRA